MARMTQKLKGGAKTKTQVLYNHYIASKPRTETSSKSGRRSRPIFTVLDPEHQAIADLLRLSHTLLSNQIPGAGRADY